MPASKKRTAVDEAFYRMFHYEWGTQFGIPKDSASAAKTKEMIQIFGRGRAARIMGSQGEGVKRRKVDVVPRGQLIDYKSIELPKNLLKTSEPATYMEIEPTSTKTSPMKAGKIDKVLEQIAGPAKTSTVKKTSQDWETFKESDKQLQDELEKQAQGKDAYLVKKDFLSRVDNRKFEIEKEGRDRERAKRAMPG